MVAVAQLVFARHPAKRAGTFSTSRPLRASALLATSLIAASLAFSGAARAVDSAPGHQPQANLITPEPTEALTPEAAPTALAAAPETQPPVQTPHPFTQIGAHRQAELRALYQEALKAVTRGDIKDPSHWQAVLADYPLVPYLEYLLLNKQLRKLPYRAVDEFLYQHEGSYLAKRLNRDWLATLHSKQHWHEFQSYYNADMADEPLTCQYLRARLLTGDETALTEVDALWNQGHSLPKACDSLLEVWRAAGRQTAALSWSRATKAMANRKITLTRYISKHAPATIKPDLERLLAVDRNPHLLGQYRNFSRQDEQTKFTILHGIQRLARKDPQKALILWQRYDAQQLFADAKRREVQESLILYLARGNHMAEAERLAASMENFNNADMVEHLLRGALAEQDWQAVKRWIAKLPTEDKQSPRWQYWATRAAEALGHELPPYPAIEASYEALANGRSYYGFFAADRLGRNYNLEDEPTQIPLADQRIVRNHSGVLRAREFYLTGSLGLARAEWYHAVRGFSDAQMQAAGTLAYQWGWHRKGIQAMIDARAWNDLTVRFPLAYAEHMEAQADALSMDANLLFAIARQESAFATDAKSSAGALGLMQLMPATARQTAGKAGMRYRKYDLLKPEFNIALGGRYLQEMLKRFGGNPALAAAAYNAGPHRVDRWLADGRDSLPMDIWIETIPFKETRNYVQNVVVFSVIYAYRNGADITQLRGATKLPAIALKSNAAAATLKAP
ncbi:transglycosylase SLT domain-containing protein [Simiduia sp. 21SJ11W-1]|uniref:transglycosylase SLT domain-containing protein n=1 Tax=Simiduia sp. 21SJ11W-1 TaxID=2909669 RepID=UPI00209E361D|nr:transglycosylase SLT domain-containing protein [Simiduia sp. 21SJ11W-1]UTA49377.1 transglycosylase SLT domain-containing protein [Simiduia sp. 21SJ11W-1]